VLTAKLINKFWVVLLLLSILVLPHHTHHQNHSQKTNCEACLHLQHTDIESITPNTAQLTQFNNWVTALYLTSYSYPYSSFRYLPATRAPPILL